MRQSAYVVDVTDHGTTVRPEQPARYCSACAAGVGCQSLQIFGRRQACLAVAGSPDFKKGERVFLYFANQDFRIGVALLYGLPLGGLLIGALIGARFGGDVSVAAGAVSGVVAGLGLAKRYANLVGSSLRLEST